MLQSMKTDLDGGPMDSFFESALRAAVLVLVVGPATAWIARHAAKERRRAAKSVFSQVVLSRMRIGN